MKAVLIATLGAEPQVVPLATQLLLQSGVDLGAVVVIHTDHTRPPIYQALPQLQTLFAQQPFLPPLQTVEVAIADVLSAAEMGHFSQVLYSTLKQWLTQRMQVHLLLAGGRKSMTMMGMSVAQLLLGAEDKVWYLHSDEGLRTSRRPQLQAQDAAQLIEIPLPRLSAAPPQLTRLFQAETPDAARQTLLEEQQRQVQHFLNQGLTAAEREVALLVAQDVLTVKEIAAQLHKSPKTVTNQLNVIYSKLESEFGLQPDVGVKREFLRRALG